MTKSQKLTGFGLALAIFSSTFAALTPVLPLMPPKAQLWIGVTGAVGGTLLSALNQSLSGAHASVPAEEVTPAGLTREGLQKVLKQVGERVVR